MRALVAGALSSPFARSVLPASDHLENRSGDRTGEVM